MTDGIDRDRLTKLEALRAAGVDPYPPRTPTPSPVAEILADFDARMGTRVTIGGRLTEIRDFGKLRFSHLHDRSGHIQVAFQRDRLGEWWPNRKKVEPADLVVITGEVGRTNKGEDTIWVEEVVLASKALRRAPTTWFGLKDVETRYRQRYVDLLSSEEVRELFATRSRIMRETRAFFDGLGYLEVETPILQPIFGGATARPFSTHHNALDMPLFLRIAPELYLKRLIVGGMERVYEIGRVFRHAGMSTRHNPEFTMLESYEAWADYNVVMERVEGLMAHLVETVRGGDAQVEFRGHQLNLKPPFQRARYTDLLAEHNNGLDFFDEPAVMARAKELGLKTTAADGSAMPFEKIANDIFEETVEKHLVGPVFVIDYPKPICPLAKASPEDPRIAERFEVFIAGMELGNAFSELNDPIDQEARFAAQLQHVDDESPSQMDEDYVTALEFGMPPAGGLGIGIDRLAMLFTGQDSIREVVLFPLLRQLQAGPQDAGPNAGGTDSSGTDSGGTNSGGTDSSGTDSGGDTPADGPSGSGPSKTGKGA